MKRNLLVGLALLLLLLSACQSSPVNTEETEEERTTEEKAKIEKKNLHENKETKLVEDIEADELYRWEIGADQTIILTNKSGEIERVDAPSMLGDEGDQLFEGVAAFYLVEAGDEHGYLEGEVELESFNIDRSFAGIYHMADHALINLYQSESSSLRSHRFWYYSDYALEQVTFEDEEILYANSSNFKVIEDEYMQSLSYDNAGQGDTGIGWHFITWLWDEKSGSFTEFDRTNFTSDQEYGWEIGEVTAEEWHTYDDYYVNFPMFTMTKLDVARIKKGILVNQRVRIGDLIDPFVEEMSRETDYVADGYYNGGPYYSFNTPFSYFYDELSREIFGISMDGYALTNGLQSLRQLLGDPITGPEYSELEDNYFEEYIIGQYKVTLYSDEGELLYLQMFKQE